MLGTVAMTKPLAYQDVDSLRKPVEASYFVDGSTYGFAVDHYDPRHTLVIDPLLASAFVGGSQQDTAFTIVVDGSGDVFVAGFTFSANYPTTAGAFDETFNGGSFDGVVSRLNRTLTGLVASTYLGGSGNDAANVVALDGAGNVLVGGFTSSGDFPITSGAVDTTHNGGSDVFVSILDPGLQTLSASTFLGGAGTDFVLEIQLDGAGDVFLAGRTTSTDFPQPRALTTTAKTVILMRSLPRSNPSCQGRCSPQPVLAEASLTGLLTLPSMRLAIYSWLASPNQTTFPQPPAIMILASI